jgi:tetratricopeptide (TPR) repeat protein
MNQQIKLVQQSEMTQAIQMLNQDIYNVLTAPADDAQAKVDALNAMLTNADNLLQKASKVDNPNLKAMAQIKAAQAIRAELHLRPEVDADMLESQIQKAKEAYQKALETAETPTIQALAKLGLGLCSEELGQTAQAAEIYKQIVEDENYKTTVSAVQAQNRLDGLEENAEVFNFADVPVVTEEPATEEIESPAAVTFEESTPAVAEPAAPQTAETAPAQQQPAEEKTPEPQAEQP